MASVARHLLSILILPFTVTVIVPVLIQGGPAAAASAARSGLDRPVTSILGILLILLGLGLVGRTVALFHRRGRGTLAPWDPPAHLVAEGVYRHVRNPMISGVLAILLGESLVFFCPGVGAWFLAFFGLNALYIPWREEPGLERRFSEEYRRYRANVPRWIPRLRPWRG